MGEKNEFSELTKADAWKRACGGSHKTWARCECKLSGHGHLGRCSQKVHWERRERKDETHWEAHHRNPSGADHKDNCQILCWPCHKQTFKD